MEILTKEQYIKLTNTENDLCLSLYLPTYRMGADIKQNPIRFKQRLREAEDKLYNLSLTKSEVENDFDDNQLNRYFRAIDESLSKISKKDKIPLVLAGVEYLIPIFKSISKYPNIIKEYIKGNPEILYGDDLHKMSWELMEPKFIKIQELAQAKYNQYKGQKNNLYANSLESIIPKAYNGQVGTVYAVDKENVRDGGVVAAVLRY